jgi:hypothetical protein
MRVAGKREVAWHGREALKAHGAFTIPAIIHTSVVATRLPSAFLALLSASLPFWAHRTIRRLHRLSTVIIGVGVACVGRKGKGIQQPLNQRKGKGEKDTA